MAIFRNFLILFGFILLASSCKVLRPSLMLKTPKDYKFTEIKDTLSKENYRLTPTDAISIRLFSNDGFKLIDLATSAGAGNTIGPAVEETVDKEGLVKVPLLGKVLLAGLTLREAQAYLEKEYEAYYVKPYVQLRITNKRVIVFPGAGGSATVVPIQNNNMTVFEALAYAGGITDEGKAYRIKLIRKNPNGDPLVYLIDLSTIKGITEGNITVLANDVIYVEPRPKYIARTASEIAPYLTLFSTGLTLYLLFTK